MLHYKDREEEEEEEEESEIVGSEVDIFWSVATKFNFKPMCVRHILKKKDNRKQMWKN